MNSMMIAVLRVTLRPVKNQALCVAARDPVTEQTPEGIRKENSALIEAVEQGLLERVRALLTIDAVRNEAHARGNLALQWAAEYKHSDIALELLRLPNVRRDAHAEGNKVFLCAVEQGC